MSPCLSQSQKKYTKSCAVSVQCPVCSDVREIKNFPTSWPVFRLTFVCFFILFYNQKTNHFMQASALRLLRRGLATATHSPHPTHIHPTTPLTSHATPAASAIPLSNVEAQWSSLNPTEQTAVHQQLEELQRRDWKTLSLSEKKAGTGFTSRVIAFVFFFHKCGPGRSFFFF